MFLHILATSRKISDVPLFGACVNLPQIVWFGIAMVGGVLLFVAYLHDGWQRGLDHNNQENMRKYPTK